MKQHNDILVSTPPTRSRTAAPLLKLARRSLIAAGACALQAAAVVFLPVFMSSAQAQNATDFGGGELLLAHSGTSEQRPKPAVQLGTRVNMTISGMVAEVVVEQRFHNNSDDWTEGKYVFPLPETAAVNAMTIRIGERVIVGEVHEKKAAKKIYEHAKHQGKRTALVSQQRENMFSSRIANIGPREEVSVVLTYLEKVSFGQGRFSLRFPMTITPRYIPGQLLPGATAGDFPPELTRSEIATINPLSGWAISTDQVPDANDITPYLNPLPASRANPVNPITIRAYLNPGLPLAAVGSSYHDIRVDRESGAYMINLVNGTVSMDRDFELTWEPVPSSVPQTAMFTETLDEQTYALVMVVPPQQKAAQRLNREVIFIIDTSGSMDGVSMEQAKVALGSALDTLAPDDTFNIIRFNDTPTKLFTSAQLATGSYLYDARRFIDRLDSGGGTEMAAALNSALDNQPEFAKGKLRQVIFITDGSVGNEDALFKLIDKKLGASRLFTIGIGSAPNSYFMRKAAQFGRGTFTYISSLNEVQQKMGKLFAQLESPVLRNVRVDWPGHVEGFPAVVPDLYLGEPLVVTAKLEADTSYASKGVRVNGTRLEGEWKQLIKLDGGTESSGIATLWARDKISQLTDQIIEDGEIDQLREAVIDVALQHKLISRYTSFVTVDKTPARPLGAALRARHLRNARPAGQDVQPYAYPQTATTAVEQFWLGLLSLGVALQLWWLRRRDLPSQEAQHV